MDIHTVDDLVRILQEHPEWRERIREILLDGSADVLESSWLRRVE
ncbi:MAG: hypothetical protein WHX60_15475 [Armatimonadota bacterium]